MVHLIGISEPGDERLGTRGNLGAAVLDALIERHKTDPFCQSRMVPELDFVNLSIGSRQMTLFRSRVPKTGLGPVIAKAIEAFNIDKSTIVLMHEDIDFKLGQIRLRDHGGDGGNEALRSIMSHTQHTDFIRVRLGIGHPPRLKSRLDFLAELFNPDETKTVLDLIDQAALAIELILSDGLAVAQKKLHGVKPIFSEQLKLLPAHAGPTAPLVIQAKPEEVSSKAGISLLPKTTPPILVNIPTKKKILTSQITRLDPIKGVIGPDIVVHPAAGTAFKYKSVTGPDEDYGDHNFMGLMAGVRGFHI